MLIDVGRRLRRSIRSYDTVGRWGGEEFCVILPGLESEEELRRAAEHLRAAISAAPLGAGPELLLAVTSSAGGALAQPGLWSVEGLIDAADRALYSAKRRGRDQTRLFSELTVEDLVAEEPEAIRLAQALALSAGAREGIAETPLRAGGRPRGVDRHRRRAARGDRDALPARRLAARPRQDRDPRRHPRRSPARWTRPSGP